MSRVKSFAILSLGVRINANSNLVLARDDIGITKKLSGGVPRSCVWLGTKISCIGGLGNPRFTTDIFAGRFAITDGVYERSGKITPGPTPEFSVSGSRKKSNGKRFFN